jgi:hypothetical protein
MALPRTSLNFTVYERNGFKPHARILRLIPPEADPLLGVHTKEFVEAQSSNPPHCVRKVTLTKDRPWPAFAPIEPETSFRISNRAAPAAVS